MQKLTMKQARVGAGMSQEDAAEAMNIHVTTYIKYERHPETMRVGQAQKFCEVVGADFEDVIFLS